MRAFILILFFLSFSQANVPKRALLNRRNPLLLKARNMTSRHRNDQATCEAGCESTFTDESEIMYCKYGCAGSGDCTNGYDMCYNNYKAAFNETFAAMACGVICATMPSSGGDGGESDAKNCQKKCADKFSTTSEIYELCNDACTATGGKCQLYDEKSAKVKDASHSECVDYFLSDDEEANAEEDAVSEEVKKEINDLCDVICPSSGLSGGAIAGIVIAVIVVVAIIVAVIVIVVLYMKKLACFASKSEGNSEMGSDHSSQQAPADSNA